MKAHVSYLLTQPISAHPGAHPLLQRRHRSLLQDHIDPPGIPDAHKQARRLPRLAKPGTVNHHETGNENSATLLKSLQTTIGGRENL